MTDDLISRKAAIDALVNSVSEIGLHDNSEVARYGATFRQHEIIDIIEGLPSAQPVRHGRWIDETFEPWGLVYHPYKCDQCGEHSEADSNYCPNCGARMKGEDDG